MSARFLILGIFSSAASAEMLHSASDWMSWESYHIWEAQEVLTKLNLWRDQYPNLMKLASAQDAFGLPRAGEDAECPFEKDIRGCSNYFFTIQDFITHPVGSESSATLPEILWSGSLNGDERIGPTVVMESAALLLEAATCEAKPSRKAASWELEYKEARNCRSRLRELGISDQRRQWLSRLVSTRRIVVVPTANSLGFYRDQQFEGDVDPDQDFAFDIDSKSCMQTIAARTMNEIFRSHMFQISVLFHSGRDGVGYSWASPSFLEVTSPDQRAQSQVAEAYSTVVGGLNEYQFGEINELFQQRRGAPEDWGYAASWDVEHVRTCSPETYGGYSEEKTTYNNSTNRAITMRVSADAQNAKFRLDLGSSLDLFEKDRKEGHFVVSRSMRLAFASVDLVEPYVSIFGVNNLALSDDIVPLTERAEESCERTKAVSIPIDQEKVIIEWLVGGAINVVETEVWYAKWGDVPEKNFNCMTQPETLDGFTKAQVIGNTHGNGFFSESGPDPPPSDSFSKPNKSLGPVFRALLDVQDFKVGDRIVVIASAKVDQDWSKDPEEDYLPQSGPQSHLVNARTNPGWKHEHGGKKIEGRLDWHSIPVILIVDDYDHKIGSLELYNRFVPEIHFGGTKDAHAVTKVDLLSLFLVTLSILVMVALFVVILYRKTAHSGKIRKVLASEMDSIERQSQFAAKVSYVNEIPKDDFREVDLEDNNGDHSDCDAEIIDFQATGAVLA